MNEFTIIILLGPSQDTDLDFVERCKVGSHVRPRGSISIITLINNLLESKQDTEKAPLKAWRNSVSQ
jgi:hypothetical protein